MGLGNLTRGMMLALSVCTRFPGPAVVPTPAAWSAAVAFLPAAGALLGLILAAAAWLLRGGPESLVALLLVALAAALTGALHLDGFADCMDAFGAERDRARALEILEDSRVGAFGVVGLVLLILAKVMLLAQLLRTPEALAGVFGMMMLSRFAIAACARSGPYAKPEGFSRPLVEAARRSPWPVLCAGLLSLGASLWLFRWFGLFLVAFSGICGLLTAALAKARIGGVTGDVLGAANELAEVCLLAVIAWPRWVRYYPVDWFMHA